MISAAYHKGDVVVLRIDGSWNIWRAPLDQMYPNSVPIQPAWRKHLMNWRDIVTLCRSSTFLLRLRVHRSRIKIHSRDNGTITRAAQILISTTI
jgi:hypothetical protein